MASRSDWVDGTGTKQRVRQSFIEASEPDKQPPPLSGMTIPPVPMVTTHCEGCGAELQIPARLHVYACPTPECRAMYWYPCEVCTEDRRGCRGKGKKCKHDDGRYIEAVLITRGGTK